MTSNRDWKTSNLRPGKEIPREILESDALRSNLEETAVDRVNIDPKYQVLQESVAGYRGILRTIESLLFELNHPYKNWEIILPEMRAFALKHFASYARHARGPEAIAAIIGVFLDGMTQASSPPLQARAIDYLLGYIEKIISELDGFDRGLLPLLNECFRRLAALPEDRFFLLASSHIPLSRLGQMLLRKVPDRSEVHEFNELLVRSLKTTYDYWLKEEDPLDWLARTGESSPGARGRGAEILEGVSHQRLQGYLQDLDRIASLDGSVETLRKLLSLPDFLEIVRTYKGIPHQLTDRRTTDRGGMEDRFFKNWKILALFKIMEIEGLQDIHEDTLREINRTLVDLIRQEPPERMEEFLLKTFSLLKSGVENYPQTALQCIQTIGAEVFTRGYSPLVETFLEQVLHFGFQYPAVKGVDVNWQLICNPSHVVNVRVWLDLIVRNPKWCSTLLSALIINLKLAGTCIKDTDLFQKEITKLLNAEIEPVYNLIKQLAKQLPVYFNEIGAEGRLRDATTEIDELCQRRDPLIHFLRKQSHVESSNLIEEFTKEIFRFWRTKDKSGLRYYLPAEVFDILESEGPFLDEVHLVLARIFEQKELSSEEQLLTLTDDDLAAILVGLPEISEVEKKRIVLLFKIYRLINQKYNLGFQEIRYHLQEASRWGFEGLDQLQRVLDRDQGAEECLEALLTYLEGLKEIILSPERFEAREDIYRKRHIAVDIPSMYGRYREKKFDALGLTFRLENLTKVYFERLIDSLDLSFITRATLYKVIDIIRYYFRAMQLDGISSPRLATQLKLLEKSLDIKRFSFTQYLDIFRGFSEGLKDVISVYYVNAHRNNMNDLIVLMGRENILPKYLQGIGDEVSASEFLHRITERLLRDLISGTFGLQYLDNFLARIQQTLSEQKETLTERDLDLLMTYDPKKGCCPIHHPNPLTNDLIHLGAKGYNLTVLASENCPVPPGFIITTEVFRCYAIIEQYKHAHEHFQREVRAGIQQIEEATGREYGNPDRPLLLAVRSGSTISMPGMMATILNVGVNEEIVEGLVRATGETWYAWDNYRRFIQSWGMSFGMEREVFSEIMNSYKVRHGVEKKRGFSGEEMKQLALAYRRAVEERHITVYEDPWAQLQVAIQQVLESWDSLKARQYREIIGISNSWGTAVIVQAMVFGNLGLNSGSGVVFTAHPYRKIRRVALWGDYTPGNQGEDIVAGLVATYPISREQREAEGREDNSLEEDFPEVYQRLFEIAKNLIYERKWNPQEIEFTFEKPTESGLYILQTRDMAYTKKEKSEMFVPSPALQESFLTKGIGVSGGAISGRVVFTLEDIQRLRREDPSTPLVLVRSDTVPEDVHEISLTEGLLTAKGGQTSHAAIVASELGKTAVVGCHNMVVLESQGRFFVNRTAVQRGDFISLEGRKGLVYLGRHEIQAEGDIYTGLM